MGVVTVMAMIIVVSVGGRRMGMVCMVCSVCSFGQADTSCRLGCRSPERKHGGGDSIDLERC